MTYAYGSRDQLRVGGCYGTFPMADASDSLGDLATGTVPGGINPDPLDGASAPTNPPPSTRDLVLASIIAAIVSLSAGIATVILKKPKR